MVANAPIRVSEDDIVGCYFRGGSGREAAFIAELAVGGSGACFSKVNAAARKPPLARSGLVAGGIMAWARAIGVFGPLMVFVGTSPRVQVMPTTMWLELSIGDIETSLVVALLAVLMAGAALALVHWLLPGRKWI